MPASMVMYFSDVNVMIMCTTGECNTGNNPTFSGDAAVDAWNSWYRHLAEKHPGWGE